MAYDPISGRLILFGGFTHASTLTGPTFGDTWAWEGSVPPTSTTTVPPTSTTTVPPTSTTTVPPTSTTTVPPTSTTTVPPTSTTTVPPTSTTTVPPTSATTVPPTSATTVPPTSTVCSLFRNLAAAIPFLANLFRYLLQILGCSVT